MNANEKIRKMAINNSARHLSVKDNIEKSLNEYHQWLIAEAKRILITYKENKQCWY